MCAIDTGVNEGEPVEEFVEQYRELEPEVRPLIAYFDPVL